MSFPRSQQNISILNFEVVELILHVLWTSLYLDHKTEDFYTESVLDSNPKLSCFYIIA